MTIALATHVSWPRKLRRAVGVAIVALGVCASALQMAEAWGTHAWVKPAVGHAAS